MASDIINIDAKMLEKFMYDVFHHAGVVEEDAKIIARILITSDLRGIESHGIQRLKYYYDRIVAKQTQLQTNFEIIRDTPTTALVDGHMGLGHVIAYKAMALAIEKAKKYGMGSVAVKNSTHFGIAGYYPIMATQAGCVGLTATNARPSISPTFSVEPMLGTNPLAYGFPTDEEFPFLLDCATSITQRGKIEIYERIKKPCPEGWVIDANGKAMIDSVAIDKALTDGSAALLPLGGVGETLGGHKGYGYATVVELLSVAFQQGPFLRALSGVSKEGKKVPYPLGHFFLAINVEAFCPLDEFKKSAGDVVRELRTAKKAPGQTRIYTAGEKEYLNELKVKKEGVPLNKSIQADIQFFKKKFNLTDYNFPF